MGLTFSVPTGLELTWALACAAADPWLDGLLLLDLPPQALPDVAAAFAGMIDDVSGRPGLPRRVVLGSAEDEDDLWSTLRLSVVDGAAALVPTGGKLVPAADEQALVVAVPDLARLSVAASRAALAMLGSSVTQLERHGSARSWPTRTYWVAACASADIGRVTPHLLDRFVLRFPAARAVATPNPVTRVLAAAAGEPPAGVRLPRAPASWRKRLRDPAPWPQVTAAAVDHALALHGGATSMRRPLSLLRLARASARIAGHDIVDAAHVEAAAVLTALVAPTLDTGATPPAEPRPEGTGGRGESAAGGADAAAAAPATAAPEGGTEIAVAEPVLLGAPADVLAARTAAPGSGTPFPEDVAEAEREATPLRLPWQRRGKAGTGRGSVVGTAPASDLRDIAWFDTLRHAAMYQRFRGDGQQRGLVMRAVDVHCYRRAPEPEHMLVLVLDHTCRRGWDWLPALAPFLHRAYTDRAAVCLVEVGGADAPALLRAERRLLRSLLDPRAAMALERRPGAATPLAHGLDLAFQSLRHALQHGRAAVTEAVLVVVTDGLGNVPLAASLQGRVEEPVHARGVADALTAAAALREMDHVRVVVVEPPDVPHPQILLELVESLSDERALVPAAG